MASKLDTKIYGTIFLWASVETHGRASLRLCIPMAVHSCNGLSYHNKTDYN